MGMLQYLMTFESRHHQIQIPEMLHSVRVPYVDQLGVGVLLICRIKKMWTKTCHLKILCHFTYRGSSSLVLPRPYSGTTFSLLIAALHTGQSCLVGRVSSHWWRHGQQNKWPHMLTTASLAVSKQILHSNIESSFFDPPPLPLLVSAFCLVAASSSICMDFIISFAVE